ncbi:MAG: long-chain fatty acid--CoA ligase [Candidatus Heimdallarchaeota archaeon]|nr:MAG: long-chain fatty acid--CoA ligase [Candidatus Heimdallarchaeota archaeon]
MEEQIWHKHKWPDNVKISLEPYPNEPLYKILEKSAEKSGELPYTIFSGTTTTYAETNDAANRVANFLVAQGVKKGDKVAIFLPNLPHYPIVFFGILKAGATVVTCNPTYTTEELKYQLKDSEAVMVFAFDHERFAPTTYEAIKGTQVKQVVICSAKDFLSKMKGLLGGLLGKVPKSPYHEEGITLFYKDIIASYEPEKPIIEINPEEDLAVLIYTGGTTGVPKGVMLTHKNIYSNILQLEEYIWINPDEGEPFKLRYGKEVFVGALPWYHSYGLTLTMIGGAFKAATVIPIPDPRAGKPPLSVVLEAIHEHKVTILHAVPTIYSAIVSIYSTDPDKYDLTSILGCGSGAAPLAPELAKEFERITEGTIYEAYGLSETSPCTHLNPTNKVQRKFGTVGFPLPDTYVKIVDLETGNTELPHGEDGEITLSGPQVMKGYWKRPEATAKVFREFDGRKFFLTGDIGHLDAEGFTVITDRKKDMIIVGGLKAYPREIEDILYGHPKVKLAAIVGLPHVENGDPKNEYVAAFLVLKDGETATEEEIIEWCRDRMAGYKRPRKVEFRDELPLSTIGKVLRRVIKEEELKDL